MEEENSILKENVREMKSTLISLPILAIPLAIANLGTTDLKLRGSSSFLMVVRKFVEENIKRRMSLIMEAWDVSSNIVSFGSQLNAYNEFL